MKFSNESIAWAIAQGAITDFYRLNPAAIDTLFILLVDPEIDYAGATIARVIGRHGNHSDSVIHVFLIDDGVPEETRWIVELFEADGTISQSPLTAKSLAEALDRLATLN